MRARYPDCEAVRLACPVLVMHGTQDAVRGCAEGEARVILLIKQFADRVGR